MKQLNIGCGSTITEGKTMIIHQVYGYHHI